MNAEKPDLQNIIEEKKDEIENVDNIEGKENPEDSSERLDTNTEFQVMDALGDLFDVRLKSKEERMLEEVLRELEADLAGQDAKVIENAKDLIGEIHDANKGKTEKLQQETQDLTTSRLYDIETASPGALLGLYASEKGEVAEKEGVKVDFRGNSSAEDMIGLGDILDTSVRYVAVQKEDGTLQFGYRTRYNQDGKDRIAFVDPSKGSDYLEIHTGYKFREATEEEFKDYLTKNGVKNAEQFKTIDPEDEEDIKKEWKDKIKEDEREALETLTKLKNELGYDFLSEEGEVNDIGALKSAFMTMSGNQLVHIRNMLGRKKMHSVFSEKLKLSQTLDINSESLVEEGIRELEAKHNIYFDDSKAILYAYGMKESNCNIFATNPQSSASGIFQMIAGNCAEIGNKLFGHTGNPFNPKEASMMALYLHHENLIACGHSQELAVKSYFVGAGNARKEDSYSPGGHGGYTIGQYQKDWEAYYRNYNTRKAIG